MAPYKVGEWVKGPFASATIEGFIVKETLHTYSIRVKKITNKHYDLPRHVKIGSVHVMPKKVLEEFFVVFNSEQQQALIALAVDLKEESWAKEMVVQFYNPDPAEEVKGTKEHNNLVYSNVLKTFVELTKEERSKLYQFYKRVLSEGMTGKVKCPEQINSSDSFDAVISAIVLISQDREGMSYIDNLVSKSST